MIRLPTVENPVTIICGDSLEILPHLSAGCIDAVVTSPPYNAGKGYGGHDDDMPLAEYWEWLERAINAFVWTLAPHGYACVNHANYIGSREDRAFVSDELKPMLERHLPFVDWIIWNKGPPNGAAWGNFQTSPRMRAQHENIFVCGGASKMPPSDITWPDWSKFTTSIWNVPTAGVDASLHPAMMPVEIARRLALLYSPAGGLLLDPFGGSGTTPVAAILEGRRCIIIEKSEAYCQIIKRRVDQALGDRAGSLFEVKKPERDLFCA